MYTKTLATIFTLSALMACRSAVAPRVGSTDTMVAQLPSADAVYGDINAPEVEGRSETERTITAEIRKVVVADRELSSSAKSVMIITQGNKVTLRGPVKDTHEKAKLEVYARRTVGVSAVDDQLEVKQ